MKILQVITSLYLAGAERLLVDMVPRYKKFGIDVDVLLFDGQSTPLKEQLLEKGVRVFCLSEYKSVYTISFIRQLVPYLKQYDIIHTHMTACQYYVALACKLYRIQVPLVTTEHSTLNRRRKYTFFAQLDRWMYGQYHRIITISKETNESLKEFLKKDIPLQIIYNGVDLDRFHEANFLHEKRKDMFVCCMVGGFREAKDQDTLIRAMKELSNDCFLWLVGDGERRPVCERLAKELGVENRIRFWGMSGDVSPILKSSDVVVLSSHWEGFGLAAVEGMAAGKPVIASNVQGLAQVVEGAGILFPVGDSHRLALSIQEIKEDKDLYQNLVERGRERAKMYDIEKTVASYIEVYKSIVNE